MSTGLGVLGPSLPWDCCDPLNESFFLSLPQFLHPYNEDGVRPKPFQNLKTSCLEAPPHGLALGVFPLTPRSYLSLQIYPTSPPPQGSALAQR